MSPMVISSSLIMFSMLPLYLKFEKREVEAEEIVLIAMISALAAVSRLPFAPLPSIQPTSFIIIMTAMVFDMEVGFLVGNTAALVSNIFLGQGPWTPWQMFSWGMMGLIGGLLKDTAIMKTKWGLCIYGFIWGFIFGWTMNLWFLLFFKTQGITWKVILGAAIASFKFDLSHALGNVVFIWLFSKSFVKTLTRIKTKYGVLR